MSTDPKETEWKRTFEMFKLEYEQAAQRYENIYKAIWQIFQYMALLSGGILTFGSKFQNSHSENVVFIALSPLVFWFLTTYIPMDHYGYNTLKRLENIEKRMNEICENENLCFWKMEHYFSASQTKPWWRVRNAVVVFGVIICAAWVISGILLFNSTIVSSQWKWIVLVVFIVALALGVSRFDHTRTRKDKGNGKRNE